MKLINFIILLCFIVIFYSCNKQEKINDNDTFIIKEGFFKDELLKNIQMVSSENIGDNIFFIEYIYTEDYNDTLVELVYAKPYTCDYIRGHMKIKNYDIFLFCNLEDKLIAKEFKINKPYNDCYKYVHERPIDSPPRVQYRVKNGRIVSRL